MLIVSVHYSEPVERESNDKNFFAGGENRVFTSCSETRYKLDLYLAFAPTGLSKILLKENQMTKTFFAGRENRVFTLRSEIRYKLDLYLGFTSTVLSN